MTDQTYWGWAQKGLGGVVNILAMLVQEGTTPNADNLQGLRDHVERLAKMLQHLSAQIRAKGE